MAISTLGSFPKPDMVPASPVYAKDRDANPIVGRRSARPQWLGRASERAQEKHPS